MEKNKDSNSRYIIEYFDKVRFREFLNSKNTYPDGILQKFIDPKGDHNFTIRLQWSPKLCILEKKINNKKIYDKRFNLYERAVTYDGEEFQTETEAIRGNNLPDRFEKIGSNISSHISNITLERIKIVRMILNFKIGKNDKIYFLWCSSLRIENFLDKKFTLQTKKDKKDISRRADGSNEIPFVSRCDTEKIQVTYPNSINLFQYSNHGKPIKVYKNILCKNCDNKVEQHKICDILFRTLVEAHDSRKRDKGFNKLFENINMTSSGVELLPYIPNKGEEEQKLQVLKNYKNLLMPKVIFALYPKLNYEDYKVLKKDTVFLSKNTQVCEKCFLDLTKYCNFAGANTENVLRVLKSNIPEDLYIRKDGYGINDISNANQTSAFKSNLNGSYNNTNGFKMRSKTPGLNVMNNTSNYNNRNGYNPNILLNKNMMNSTTGNIGVYSNMNKIVNNYNSTNQFNSNLNSYATKNHNKYKPDFSSKIKFIIEPKKDIKTELLLNRERELHGINSGVNQIQNSFHSSNNNNNNLDNVQNNSKQSLINLKNNDLSRNSNNSKNNSIMEHNENILNPIILSRKASSKQSENQRSKNNSRFEKENSKDFIKQSENNIDNFDNNKTNKSNLSKISNHKAFKEEGNLEESKIQEKDGFSNKPLNEYKDKLRAAEILNKLELESLHQQEEMNNKQIDGERDFHENHLNSQRENIRQPNSESEDDEGYDNQSEEDIIDDKPDEKKISLLNDEAKQEEYLEVKYSQPEEKN